MVVSAMARIPQRAVLHIHDSGEARTDLGGGRADSCGCSTFEGIGAGQGEPVEESSELHPNPDSIVIDRDSEKS